MTPGEQFAASLPRLVLIVGKGGVGKTTCAAGLAEISARLGARTLVVTTDPAGTLGAFFNVTPALVTPAPVTPALVTPAKAGAHVAVTPTPDVWIPDPRALRDAFLDKWRDTIATIVDRGTYLDRDDIDGLVDAALPGGDEIFELLALADQLGAAGAQSYERIIVDTAPTGHTLRLLDLPRAFEALVALLDTMQDKHRFMVRALTHRYKSDAADNFLSETRTSLANLSATLRDATRTAALLVTRAEPVVTAETARYAAELSAGQISVRAVIVNRWRDSTAARSALAMLETNQQLERLALDDITPPPATANAAATLLDSLHSLPVDHSQTRNASRKPSTRKASHATAPLGEWAASLPPLVIVGGKGGVGKTTVATALAINRADAGERVLLVSTDPAPSIADALGEPIGDEEHPVTGAPGLDARQMDAPAAYARFRDEYRERIDALFGALVSGGMDATYDRRILADLLSFAPPGLDELYALALLGDALAEGRYDRVIVDPAPTGHLLRLLDMPAIALDWTHRLMRLVLKYRDVASIEGAGEGLLTFARRTRGLDERLHDASAASVVIVALDEPVVRGETRRLAAELARRNVALSAMVWNRYAKGQPLPTFDAVAQFVADEASDALIGVAQLRAFLGRLRVASA